MKRLILLMALGVVCVAASACDDTRPTQVETAQPPAESIPTPIAPPPSPATTAETASPSTATDNTALPPDQRQSEETVKPESETLFY